MAQINSGGKNYADKNVLKSVLPFVAFECCSRFIFLKHQSVIKVIFSFNELHCVLPGAQDCLQGINQNTGILLNKSPNRNYEE